MDLAGEGLGLFLTSIQDSESKSGRLAERPLGIVLRLEVSDSILVLCFTGVEALAEPGADTIFRLLIVSGKDVNPQITNAGLVSFKENKLV